MREIELRRTTKETNIHLKLNLDSYQPSNIQTGIGFFDHMLHALAMHMDVSLELICQGDLHVDCHHLIEDTGIVLGMAFAKVLGDKKNIQRYGHAYIPMDEALGFAVIDFGGRPFLVFEAEFKQPMIGEMDTQMIEEFFRAFTLHCGATLHLEVVRGKNEHHKVEALFKAFAHALKQSVAYREGETPLSTKGII